MMADPNPNSEHQSMLWAFLGIPSSIVGLVCYALSSSFKQLFGEWKFYKLLLYIMIYLIICGLFLLAKKIKVSNSVWVKALVGYLVLMLTSLYSYFYDKAVKGIPDALSIISYAAFALTSLCFSRKFELGFEVGFFYFFLECFTVQLMKIHFILVVLAAVFCFSIIIVRFYSNSEDHTGTTGTVGNLEIIVDPANGISNQADSNEESPLLPSIGVFPGNSYSGHNQENVEAEPTEQHNVSSEIQLYAHSNVSSEPTELHNVSSEIQLYAHSNVSSEPTEQHNIFFEIQSDAQSNIFSSPLLPSIGAFPGNSYSRHNQENVEIELIDYYNVFSEIQSNGYHNVSFEIQSNGQSNVLSEPTKRYNISFKIQSDAHSNVFSVCHVTVNMQRNISFEIQSDAHSNVSSELTEQRNIFPEIQSDAHFNVFSESTEQHNILSEIQSDVQSSQLRRRHRPRKPNDVVINRPLVAENFSAIDLLIALGPGRSIFELCTATIHFLNSWWKKIRTWREKIQVSCSSWVKAHVGFSCLMLASLYCFFYYQVVKGNAYALSIISYAALATSLGFSGKFKFGFEVVFFTSFLGRVGVPLMTIHLILVVLGGFFCYSFIIVLSYSDSQDRTGTPRRSGVNLEQIRNDRANGVSNQADSSEESHPIGVSNEPMMAHRRRRP